MKMNEYDLGVGKFIYSRNEYAFIEVLDAIPTAKKVAVVTFNISKKRDVLLGKLKKVSGDCELNIITNIPGRFDKYFKKGKSEYGEKSYAEKARESINTYLSLLNPENFNYHTHIFFDNNNHSKIVMTESIAYIGSANFSDESKSNGEVGIISKDTKFLSYLWDKVLPEMKRNAFPYYDEKFTKELMDLEVQFVDLFGEIGGFSSTEGRGNIKDILLDMTDFEGIPWAMSGEKLIYYNQWSSFVELIKSANGRVDYLVGFLDDFDNTEGTDLYFEYNKKEAIRIQTEIKKLSEQMTQILDSFNIKDLAEYDIDSETLEIFRERYDNGDGEALDDGLSIATEDVNEQLERLNEAAESSINELVVTFVKYIQNFDKLISHTIIYLPYYLRKVNPDIDNTAE